MAKFKRKFKEVSIEDRLDDFVHDNMTQSELNELLVKLRKMIRMRSTTKSSVRLTDGYLETFANKMLEHFDSMDDKEIAYKILEATGDELIRAHHGDKLDDLSKLSDSYKKGMKTLLKIHGKTLIERNARIPDNLSESYIHDLLSIGYISKENNLLYDNNVVNFLVRMGESVFAIKKAEEYKEIISKMVIDSLQNNPALAKDPRISHNRELLDIAIQYVRALDTDNNSNRSDIETIKVLKTIKNVFGEYIDSLPEKEREFIENKINRYSAFEFRTLKKDITAYTSFADFMADASAKDTIEQDPVAPHVKNPVIPVNHGSKMDNVMIDDEKFRAIQDAVTHLREKNPRITVGTVLVGVKDPFKGYILFPLENMRYKVELNKEEDSLDVGSNLVMSEIFGNTKGGALYIMTKSNADRVFSITNPNQVGTNNGPGTRTISKSNRPGLVTVHHYTMDGYLGYQSMVFDALDDITANPNINTEYRRPRKHITRPIGSPLPKRAKSQTAPAKTNVGSNQTTQNVFNVQTSRDPNDFDEIGVCVEDLKAVKIGRSELMPYSRELMADITSKYEDKTGLKDAKELKLLDYVIERMFIDGKSFEDISEDLGKKYGVDPLQAFSYVRSITTSIAKLDPTHATETLKGLYKSEIDRMKTELEQMRIDEKAKAGKVEMLEKRKAEIKKIFGKEDR